MNEHRRTRGMAGRSNRGGRGDDGAMRTPPPPPLPPPPPPGLGGLLYGLSGLESQKTPGLRPRPPLPPSSSSSRGFYGLSDAPPSPLPLLPPPPPDHPRGSFYGLGGGALPPMQPVASDVAPPNVFTREVAAEWIDYTRVKCVSPPWPTPEVEWFGRAFATRSCVVTVSNDGDQYDDVAAAGGDGGSGGALHPHMPNAALVPFYYDPRVPTVTGVTSPHGAPAALSYSGRVGRCRLTPS